MNAGNRPRSVAAAPWPELFFPALDSTMDEARRVALRNEAAPDAFRVRSALQWRGRGRRGRAWYDRPGGAILTTLAIRRRGPFDPRDSNPGTLALRIGGAVLHAVGATVERDDVRIKWPNDIIVGSRKLCGILVEADSRWFLVGIGINGMPPLRSPFDAPVHYGAADPVSLRELGWPGGYHAFLSTMDASIARFLVGSEWREVVSEHLAWRGESVVVIDERNEVSGIIRGIDGDGSMVLDTASGALCVVSGTVRRAPATS
ncbi:MAG: biotin--[acetyl-CoA-carboxylase] ligase [Spirochaetales bacterium]|nr:biotin--[acetyl-CoA-carboxylase] ligase [Spirochaetales bacterium]